MGVCASHSHHTNGDGRIGSESNTHGKNRKLTSENIPNKRSHHMPQDDHVLFIADSTNRDGSVNLHQAMAKDSCSYLPHSASNQVLQPRLENNTGLLDSTAGDDEVWFDSQASFASDSPDELNIVNGNDLSLSHSDPENTMPSFSAHKDGMVKTGCGICETSADGLSVPSPSCSDKLASMSRLFDNGTLEKDQWESSTLDVNAIVQKLSNEFTSENEYSKPKKNPVLEATFQVNAVAPVMDGSADLTEHHEVSKTNEAPNSGSCLPRLLNGRSFKDKRKTLSLKLRQSSQRKVSFLRRLSLKSNESSKSWDSREVLQKPIAGAQVPCCLDGNMEGCWSMFNPSTFKLRTINFSRDKRKEPAPPLFVFEPIGVDLFFSPKKINHITRFVELSFGNMMVDSSRMSDLLVVNIQIPLYPASMFGSINDGEGLNLVMYFKLSEKFKKQAPPHLKEMLRKFLNNEVEKVKGLVGDFSLHFRERLKIVARLTNPDELDLSATEKKLVTTYNEKPVLSRPQHMFFKENNYLEIDLDVHRFSFIARKALESFHERLKLCILDIGLVIQGNKPEELPEYMLCGVRLHKIDFSHAKVLGTSEEH